MKGATTIEIDRRSRLCLLKPQRYNENVFRRCLPRVATLNYRLIFLSSHAFRRPIRYLLIQVTDSKGVNACGRKQCLDIEESVMRRAREAESR
jgi:hypothetical protein